MQSSSEPYPKVTVVIPNWNGMQWLERCFNALQKQTMSDFAVILVDNGSKDGSAAFTAERHPAIRVIELGRNTGFAHAANVGIRAATSPYVALLNTDTEVYPDWLAHLVAALEAAPEGVAAIAPQMLNMNDPTLIDDAGDELSWYGDATKRGHGRPATEFSQPTEIFSPSAGASLYRRSFLEAAGGFDEAFFAYLEDVDLGLRGRLMGYRYLYEPRAKVAHKGHGSAIRRHSYVELMTRNRLMLFCKNVPLSFLLRHAPRIIYGQYYFLIAYARPWASLKGYASFAGLLPSICRERRKMLAEVVLDPSQLDRLFNTRRPGPSLVSSACARIATWFKRLRVFRIGRLGT